MGGGWGVADELFATECVIEDIVRDTLVLYSTRSYSTAIGTGSMTFAPFIAAGSTSWPSQNLGS